MSKSIESRIADLERRLAPPPDPGNPIIILAPSVADPWKALGGDGHAIAEREEGETVEAFLERVNQEAGEPRTGCRLVLPDNGRSVTPTADESTR